jgi:two-component system, NtrC family, sensor kinase
MGLAISSKKPKILALTYFHVFSLSNGTSAEKLISSRFPHHILLASRHSCNPSLDTEFLTMQSLPPDSATPTTTWGRWYRLQVFDQLLRSKANRMINQLKIHQKIGYGYGLAIGITTFGTVMGLAIGNYHQVQARNQLEYTHHKASLLAELKSAVLEARLHQQQLIPLINQPTVFTAEYDQFLASAARANQFASELQSLSHPTQNGATYSEASALAHFLQIYRRTTENYFQQTNALVQKVDLNGLKSSQVHEAEHLMLSAISHKVITEIEFLSDQLTHMIGTVNVQEKNAEVNLKNAEALRIGLTAIGMLVSILFAVLLVNYTSRAIARPIEAVTSVARRATQNSDLELQAPVTTDDEVGILATSLNHFIQRIKCLMQEQQQEAKRQAFQNEKMSSLGELMAGLAHEINNPLNFIYGNLKHTEECITDLLSLINIYENEASHSSRAAQFQADAMDLDFVKEDLPKQLRSMKAGAERVRQIVLSLRDFSRVDETTFAPVDVHECIDSTLLLLKSRLKKGINITRNYGDVPNIEGFSGSLYQVFMNLFCNAIDALEEIAALEVEDSSNPECSIAEIVITTRTVTKDWIEIQVTDNGAGIPSEIQKKIFDAFFTTKPRGIGTGLGLPISYQIVVEKHGGRLTCSSQVGQGTTFSITLPVFQREREAERAILQLNDDAMFSNADAK